MLKRKNESRIRGEMLKIRSKLPRRKHNNTGPGTHSGAKQDIDRFIFLRGHFL